MKKRNVLYFVLLFLFFVGSQAEAFPNIPEDAELVDLTNYFNLVGDARLSPLDTRVFEPVPSGQFTKVGAMWSKNRLDLTRDFEMELYVNMYSTRATLPADGFTFTLHNDPRGGEDDWRSGSGDWGLRLEFL